MAEIALLLWARIQISMERKDPTIPTAASASVPNSGIFPTTAASVLDNTGSAIPDKIAGIASCCILLKEISVLIAFKNAKVTIPTEICENPNRLKITLLSHNSISLKHKKKVLLGSSEEEC
jgi:hypothetical protein